MWILIIGIIINIIIAKILIFIGSNLDNCDKFKIPKYDKFEVPKYDIFKIPKYNKFKVPKYNKNNLLKSKGD